MYRGIDQMIPGNHLADISQAIQTHAESNGFSLVREFGGHGIGKRMHEDPMVLNYVSNGRGIKLKPGLVLAVEPMVNMGKYPVKVLADGWTVVTCDGKPSAHFEHTIAVTENGPGNSHESGLVAACSHRCSPTCVARSVQTQNCAPALTDSSAPIAARTIPCVREFSTCWVRPGDEVITPFQRVMQTPLIVGIYENFWRRAGYYLASSRSFSREMDTILRHERERTCARVLDLACGPGIFTRPLARQTSGIVVGFDLSWPMLRRAHKLVEREGLKNVVLIRGTAFHLPFVASAFDYVNCCGALHLFDKPGLALKEIDRVLRPEGHLCVQTTIRPEHSGGIAFLLERFIRFGFFGESELLEIIRSHRLHNSRKRASSHQLHISRPEH